MGGKVYLLKDIDYIRAAVIDVTEFRVVII